MLLWEAVVLVTELCNCAWDEQEHDPAEHRPFLSAQVVEDNRNDELARYIAAETRALCSHTFLDLPDGLPCQSEPNPEAPGSHIYVGSSLSDLHDASEMDAEASRG